MLRTRHSCGQQWRRSSGSGERHILDFLALATVVAAADFRSMVLQKKDTSRLRSIIAKCRAQVIALSDEHDRALGRVERAIGSDLGREDLE